MPDYGEASINSGAMHGLLRFPGFKVPPPSAALLQKTGRSVFEVRLPAKTVAKTASTRSNALVSLIQVNDRQYGLSSSATCARPSPAASTSQVRLRNLHEDAATSKNRSCTMACTVFVSTILFGQHPTNS